MLALHLKDMILKRGLTTKCKGTTKNAHTQVKRENYARKLLKVLLSRLFYPKIVKKCNSNLNFRVFLLYYIIA